MILSTLASEIGSRLVCLLLTAGQAVGDTTGGIGARAIRPPYRPFLDPIDVHGWWWVMLLPMSVLIAVVYKSVRLKDLRGYWAAVLGMTAQIVIGMVLLGVASYVLVEVYARWMMEHAPR
jgi:hypothetical protein